MKRCWRMPSSAGSCDPALLLAHAPRLRCGPMKLGYMIGYWGAGPPTGVPEALAEAERLGFDSCWTAEAYGSDALDAARVVGRADVSASSSARRSVSSRPARRPRWRWRRSRSTTCRGGRFILGLGASGPQVAEGWYGDDYRKPLARTREYVEIVRQVLARESAGRVPR